MPTQKQRGYHRQTKAAVSTRPIKRAVLKTGSFILLLCLVLLFLLDRGFRPILQEFCQVQAKFSAVTAINCAVSESLKETPVDYDEIVEVHCNAQGAVTSLKLNSAALNSLSSRLTLAANRYLERLPLKKIYIPLGTVMGWQLLSGRGPDIGLLIQPTSYVESEVISTLEDAGINQTLHKITLRFTVKVETFAVGYHTMQTIISDVVVAQTVIVGEVPNFYANS